MEAQLPTEEEARLETLRSYRILDTPPEKDFDKVVRLAAELCETPIALISLVDRDRVWFKGRYGLELTETPRRFSFCAQSILQAPATTEVPDALQDPRFADNELVTGSPRVRFYAAAPLVSREGRAMGTLCAMDTRPRHLEPKQTEALRALARLVMMHLELRRSVGELERAANVAATHLEEHTEQQALLWKRTAELARVQDESRRSAERFRALAEAAFEGIVFLQPLRVVDCNEQFETLSGYTRQELLGTESTDLLPPEEQDLMRRTAWERQEGTLELHLRRKDGTCRVIEARGRYMPRSDMAVAVMRDITDRKAAEEALRRSEARLGGLVNSALDAIISIDEQQRIVLLNPAAEKLFGVEAEEVLGDSINRFIPQRYREAHARHLEEFSRSGVTNRQLGLLETAWGVRANGEEFPFEASLSQVALPAGKLVTVILRDITERLRAEEQARLWQRMFEAADFGLACTSARNNTWLAVNASFARQRGYTPEELIGQSLFVVSPPEVRETIQRRLAEVDATGHLVYESVHQRKDGSRFPVLIEVTVIRDARGQPESRVTYALDIREIVAARETLARSREELERLVRERTAQLAEANANLQNFAYTAAHDLRSPLRGIANFSQLLVARSSQRLDEMSRSMLERVADSADQMSRLLDDLLEYSKIAQGDLRLEKVQLEAAVREALALLEGDIRAKQADVSAVTPLPEVIGHPATVVMLVSNLVSNGLKFMPEGVKPRVRLWAEPRVPGEQRGMVRLWVEDNGIGIAPENQEKVFGAFQRLHGKEAYPGTGLGLAIVRKGVERMGGRVGLESEVGNGSRFWVELRSTE